MIVIFFCRKWLFFAFLTCLASLFKVNVNFFGDSSMPRKRSRKVLYEVSSEARKARSKRPKLEITKRARAFTKKVMSGRAVKLKEKSVIKPVGFKRNLNVLAGRLMNFSMKKALIVLVIFAAVVIFWPGDDKTDPVDSGPGSEAGLTVEPKGSGKTVGPEEGTTEGSGVGEVGGPPKDHYIVIASHGDLDQLKALLGHFAINGIKTEIKKSETGGMHTLITKDRYYKPGDLLSGIDQAKAKIKDVGNKYKPDYSSGYLRFKFDGIYEQKVR